MDGGYLLKDTGIIWCQRNDNFTICFSFTNGTMSFIQLCVTHSGFDIKV